MTKSSQFSHLWSILIGAFLLSSAVMVPPVQGDSINPFWPATITAADDLLNKPIAKNADADAWARRAWALSRYRSDHAEAAEAAAKAIALDADHYRANEIAGLIAQLQGHYEAAFEHYLKLLNPGRMESCLYLNAYDNLNLTRSQRDRLLPLLMKAAENENNPQPYRAFVRRRIAQMLAKQGELAAAAEQCMKLQPVTDWMVIGPFANEENAGFGQENGPETEIDYSKRYQGRDRKVEWERLRHIAPTGGIDLDAVMYPNTQVLAYALTFVHVDKDTDVVARFGAGTAVKLWINDYLLLSDDEDIAYVFDQYSAACTLKAGWNKVLVKICERGAAWRLSLRFTSPDGTPLALKTDAKTGKPLEIRTTPKETNDATVEYAGSLYDHFLRLHKMSPQDPAVVYYLAQAEAVTARKMDCVASFENLVSLNDQCSDHHALLAKAYQADERPEKALVSMKKALAIEPAHVECLAELGQFYDNANLFEKALATLNKAIKTNSEWPDAQFYLMQVYSGKNWEEHVWRQAQWLLSHKPDVSWVLSTYADHCQQRGFREEAETYYKKVLAEEYDDSSARMSLINMAVEQRQIDEALKQRDILIEIQPLSIGLRLAKARLLMQYERYEEAMAVCKETLDICPANSGIHTLIGTLYQRLGEDNKAIAAWKIALEYEPDNNWIREYLEFLEPETIAAFDEYGISDETAAEIIENRADPEDYPKADAVTLLDHLVVQLNEDGSYTSLRHRIIQILNDSGREQFTSMYGGGYSAKIKRAVVIQPDGSEVEASRVSGGSVKFGQLQVGSIIELKAQSRGSSNEWLSRHYTKVFRFQGGVPMRHSEFIILVPASRSIRYYLQGDRAKLTKGEFEGQEVFDFLAQDVPMVEPESNRPPASDILDLVRLSTIEDWDEIARWEHSLVKDQFVADDSVRAKIKELTEGLETREEKIRALASFVMQKIQYRQDYDRAIMGMKPHKAGNVLEKQVGDCKDKANLLITMLREIGVSANYVGLRTRSAGKLIRDIPSNQCNHAIVYVPDENDFSKGLWIDGTANYSGIDTLPAMDQGLEVMVLTEEGKFVFMNTPVDTPDHTLNQYENDITLSPDGSGHVQFTLNATGQMASTFRRALEAEGLRRQLFEQFANGYFPGSKVTSVEVSDLDNRDIPVKVVCEFDAPNIGQVAGKTMTIRLREFMHLTRQYANRSERTYNVWNGFTATHRFIETFHLPEGFSVQSSPAVADLETPWLAFKMNTTTDGNTLSIERLLSVKTLEIPKSAYDELRTFCIDADKSQKEPVILENP